MTLFNLEGLRRTAGALGRRVSAIFRPPPKADSLALHASETPIRRRLHPVREACRRSLVRLAGLIERISDSVRRAELLALWRIAKDSDENSSPALPALVAAVESELAGTPRALEVDEGDQLKFVKEAALRIARGQSQDVEALRALADGLLADVRQRGAAKILPSSAGDLETRFAEQALARGRLAAFLLRDEALRPDERQSFILAAVLLDVGLLPAKGRPASAASHAARSMDALAKLDLLPESFLLGVGAHHDRADERRPSVIGGFLAVVASFIDYLLPPADLSVVDSRQAMRDLLLDVESGRLDREWGTRLLEISFYPVGALVELAGGEHAEVVATQRIGDDLSLAALPIVKVVRNAEGRPLADGPVWNLALWPDRRVVRALPNTAARAARAA